MKRKKHGKPKSRLSVFLIFMGFHHGGYFKDPIILASSKIITCQFKPLKLYHSHIMSWSGPSGSESVIPFVLILKPYLVGGFNPIEKYAHQNGNLPQNRGENKNIWNHHLVINPYYLYTGKTLYGVQKLRSKMFGWLPATLKTSALTGSSFFQIWLICDPKSIEVF